MTQSLLVAALRYAERYPSQDGVALTPIAGFAIVRETQPSALQYSVSKPLVALSLQGTKRVTLGTNTLDFGVGESLLIITDVPTFSQITGASLTAPYVSLVVELDAAIIESPGDSNGLHVVLARRSGAGGPHCSATPLMAGPVASSKNVTERRRACRGRSFRLHLLRFHLCFLSNGFVSRRSPEYHQVRHVPPPLFQTPLQRSKLAARIGIRVLRPKAGKQFCRRSPGLSLKPGAELNGHECERIRCVALLPRPWRLPPSRRSNLPLLPCGPQTEEELFERRLFDQERNLRRVGNFYQPSLTSTNVVQQADRIEGLKLRLDLPLYLIRRPRIGDQPLVWRRR